MNAKKRKHVNVTEKTVKEKWQALQVSTKKIKNVSFIKNKNEEEFAQMKKEITIYNKRNRIDN